MECFKCEISGSKARLFDAISAKGIVKICEKCSKEENIPIINKPTESQFDEYKKKTKEPQQIKKSIVYEKLSRMSGISVEDGRHKSDELIKDEVTLKKIANKNFEDKITKQKPKSHLIDNFHWVIMRARRLKKITQGKLAEEISEPESAIIMAEKGILPEDDKILMDKLERRLGIRLLKDDFREQKRRFPEESFSEKIDFKSDETKILTISDLQEIKHPRESKILSKPSKEESPKEEIILNKKAKEDEPEFLVEQSETGPEIIKKEEKDLSNKSDLTDKDIDDILFGKR